MATTTIENGNVYLTNGTVSGNTITHNTNEAVEIFSAKIDYDSNNELQSEPIPLSKGNRGVKTVHERVIDLKRFKKAITVQGLLVDEASESATAKRNNIISLAENKGGLRLVWGTDGNYRTIFGDSNTDKVFIQKFKFTETTGYYGDVDVTAESPPERKIDIQLILVIGKDL